MDKFKDDTGYVERVAGVLLATTGVDHSDKTPKALSAIHDGGLHISNRDPFDPNALPPKASEVLDAEVSLEEMPMDELQALVDAKDPERGLAASRILRATRQQLSGINS